MPDDFRGDRTEAPTPRRRQEAREQGQVARSQDLSSALFLLGAFIGLYWMGSDLVMGMGEITRRVLGDLAAFECSVPAVVRMAAYLVMATGRLLLPFLGVLLLVAVGINLLQVGFIFTGRSLAPQFSRINPISGFGKLFSLQSGVRLAMSLLKVVLISLAIWWVIRQEMGGFAVLADRDAWGILAGVSGSIFSASMKLGMFLLMLAALDYLFQRWQHEQEMRMTKQEVKDELRRYEGDPLIRHRRLQLQRQFARERMMRAVQKADVVITNPTHLAVALQYDPEAADAPPPRIVAKGARLMALRIREIADRSGVPIVERKPLAQALYKACNVGDLVPADLFRAVAEVLSFVYSLDPRRREKMLRSTSAGPR